MLQHYYKTVGEEWFTYPKLYSKIVADAKDGSHFVEIGCWKGMSASFMGVEIINSGKKIRLDCIDTWRPWPDLMLAPAHIQKEARTPDCIFRQFLKNTEPVRSVVKPVRLDSISASLNYTDNQLDFAFIDAGHDYVSVLHDLRNWYPKVKPGCPIAGHDYEASLFPEVKQAVHEFFEDKNVTITSMENCWLVTK